MGITKLMLLNIGVVLMSIWCTVGESARPQSSLPQAKAQSKHQDGADPKASSVASSFPRPVLQENERIIHEMNKWISENSVLIMENGKAPWDQYNVDLKGWISPYDRPFVYFRLAQITENENHRKEGEKYLDEVKKQCSGLRAEVAVTYNQTTYRLDLDPTLIVLAFEDRERKKIRLAVTQTFLSAVRGVGTKAARFDADKPEYRQSLLALIKKISIMLAVNRVASANIENTIGRLSDEQKPAQMSELKANETALFCANFWLRTWLLRNTEKTPPGFKPWKGKKPPSWDGII
ncbi:MAG: hypothetical protein HY537_03630 [Deltaproteobacteria bacterium]|nr:hypothetical protein [Deltaproteobacteria bacterium]